MHTLEGKVQCSVEKCKGVQCILGGSAMHTGGGYNAQWRKKERNALAQWGECNAPLAFVGHLVDEMLMPWAVQRFSLQRCPVLDGQFTVHCTVYNVHSQCSAVW